MARDTQAQGMAANAKAIAARALQRQLLLRGFSPARVTQVMATPPTVSLTTTATTTISGGVDKTSTDAVFTWLSTVPVPAAADASALVPGHVSNATNDATNKQPQALGRIRFVTDAPKFEIKLRNNNQGKIRLKINGQWNTDTIGITPNGDAQFSRMVVDFGAPVKTFYPQSVATINAAGTGYALNDTVTLVGGTGTASTFRVSSVSGGTVTSLIALTQGAYSVQPSSPIATTSSGAGTGLTVTPIWAARYTNRVMRDVEVWGSGLQFRGVGLGPQDAILPVTAPAVAGRMIFIGDSITTSSYQDVSGDIWDRYVADALGFDDFWQSGQPGTGWLATGGVVPYLGQRLATDILPYITDHTVIVINLGVNDSNVTSAAVQAEAVRVLNLMLAANKNVLIVVLSPFTLVIDNKAAIIAALQTATTLVSDTKRIRWVDPNTAGIVTGLGVVSAPTGTGTSDWYRTDDGTHFHKYGHSEYGIGVAPLIGTAIASMLPEL
jgi:lysophospholipase L1-like esterase